MHVSDAPLHASIYSPWPNAGWLSPCDLNEFERCRGVVTLLAVGSYEPWNTPASEPCYVYPSVLGHFHGWSIKIEISLPCGTHMYTWCRHHGPPWQRRMLRSDAMMMASRTTLAMVNARSTVIGPIRRSRDTARSRAWAVHVHRQSDARPCLRAPTSVDGR